MTGHHSYEISDLTVAVRTCEALLRNISDERARWLASQLREWLEILGEIYHSAPSADTWVKIREFQLKEITDAIQATRNRLDQLEAQELELMPKLESATNDRAEAHAEQATQERA